VEADAALRRIIALGLRRRGLEVIEARTLGEVWERVTAPPAAVVLDIGLGAASEWMVLRALGGHAALRQAPLVLLAWDCPAALGPAEGGHTGPARICLTKPFDARALYAAVERLVAAPALVGEVAVASGGIPAHTALVSATPLGDATGRSEPLPLGRQLAAPSAWPLVAAGAATLAVAGFLIRPAFAVIGLVLLVAALLWWSTASVDPATTG
jgi:CheY-like chemotaxis protein